MQSEHISVGDLFAGEWTYTVPPFQRPYVWDDTRWKPLWEDVERVAEEAFRNVPKVHPICPMASASDAGVTAQRRRGMAAARHR